MTQNADDLFKTLAEQQYYHPSEGVGVGGGGVSQDQFVATSTAGMNLHFGDGLASLAAGSNNNNASIEEIVTSSGNVSESSNNDKSSAHNNTTFSSTPNSSNVSSIEYLLALQQQVVAANAVKNQQQQHQKQQSDQACPSETFTTLPWEVNGSTSCGGSTFTGLFTQPQRRMSNSYAIMFGGEINNLMKGERNATNTTNNAMKHHPMLSTLLLNQQHQNLSNLPNAMEAASAVVPSNSNNNVLANYPFADLQHAAVAANTHVGGASLLSVGEVATNAPTRQPPQKIKQAGFPCCRLDNDNNHKTKKKSKMRSYRHLWSNMLRHKSQQEQEFVKRDFLNRLASGTVPILKDTSLCQFYNKDGTNTAVAAAAATEQQRIGSSSSSPPQIGTTEKDSSAPDKITFRKEPNLPSSSIIQRGQKRKAQNPALNNNMMRSTTESSSRFLKSASVTTTATKTTSANDDARKKEEQEDRSYTNHILNQARWMHAI
eukprot:CAMPEP_0195283544 /NCGR_PEP_ID=MMETSP0707-20130614/2058_1 /TAXON_ID=33640 /ORGANISM="Asterionellopsis glacialis, Strain CCMP134" /LENGTH=486 /DNA_ID=CAMNT_0040342729 /DNA_START=9 /DNA_END=1469 /DNA_ORIENTATION=-